MTANILISHSAQSRTCLWVSAVPRYGEDTEWYLDLTAPVSSPAFRNMRGHLEATTVRAFLVSSGFPTAGVTEEAHLHCRTCGWGFPPIQGRQNRTETFAGQCSSCVYARFMVPGSPPAGSRKYSCPHFVLRPSPGLSLALHRAGFHSSARALFHFRNFGEPGHDQPAHH